MLENQVDVIQAYKIVAVFPATVKHLIREGTFTTTRFGNKRTMERDRLHVSFNSNDDGRRRMRRL